LVGATWQYIRGPFLIEGALFGVLGALLSSTIIWVLLYQLLNMAQNDFSGLNIASLGALPSFAHMIVSSKEGLSSIFSQLFFLQLGAGVLLGVFCSAYGVRKYLKE
jgi:cell division transport system permease protein